MDFRLIVTDLTLPISTVFAGLNLSREPSSRLPAADVPFGTQTNKKVFLLAPAGPPIQLLPFRPFGFSFTALVTLSEMN